MLGLFDYCDEFDPRNAFASYYLYLFEFVKEKKSYREASVIVGLINLLRTFNILLGKLPEEKAA